MVGWVISLHYQFKINHAMVGVPKSQHRSILLVPRVTIDTLFRHQLRRVVIFGRHIAAQNCEAHIDAAHSVSKKSRRQGSNGVLQGLGVA